MVSPTQSVGENFAEDLSELLAGERASPKNCFPSGFYNYLPSNFLLGLLAERFFKLLSKRLFLIHFSMKYRAKPGIS